MGIKIKAGNKVITYHKYKYFPKNRRELSDIIDNKLDNNKEYIDVSDIDISNLDKQNIGLIFSHYDHIEVIDGFEYWNTTNIKKMYQMFQGCTNLKRIDLSNWDVSNVERFDGMFDKCNSLETIGDVSNWKISKNADIDHMFTDCPLKFINDVCKKLDIM